ncbi:chemotaxis protein CheA [Halodesulfovibrio marinisediminis]|uniref:Chemotaxis protein CheA n=1 Tax=Halodesulfovibrio marinisediminis DSM 17456 TaxID=1121457 RepID=A0A1N6DIF6_9BACT|nr:chemotaxis protein CheA [Halodesulfovibrio marinisediminis]SIN70585.1 two-component system, chemotaxis family, sensor kinase CheA [Halodesulfovibrio marinisediminis DSM 17456]
MSQEFLDPEIFADFIIEAKEHLETIEPNLLELEKDPEDISLLNEIFRPMHSLKGASGFLGLNKMNTLAHRAENIMDELRKGTMEATPAIMDVILEATDALRRIIDNLENEGEEGDVATEPIIQTLDALLAGEEPTQAAEPISFEQPAAVEETPLEAVQEASAIDYEDAEFEPSSRNVVNLPEGELYALTSFGEGHLRDFIEEAFENTADLSNGLLELEQNPEENDALVNDLFRFFHNLKGNSGIIGFNELNSITHEAETLLNRTRKGELPVTQGLIDLLLRCVDIIDTLVSKIDVDSGQVPQFDLSEILSVLRHAVEHGEFPEATKEEPAPVMEEESVDVAEDVPEYDKEDMDVFLITITQQRVGIDLAIKALEEDSSQEEFINSLYRSLITTQNSCSYMQYDKPRVQAERTAGLVDSGRNADMDFSLMLDLLVQEIEILNDMVDAELAVFNLSINTEEELKGVGEPSPEPQEELDMNLELPDSGSTEAPVSFVANALVEEPEAIQEPVTTQPEPQPVPPVEAPKVSPKPEPKVAPKSEAKAAPKAAPAPAKEKAPAKQQKPKSSSTIRVDHEKLDHLMNLIGELIINRNRYTMLARNLEDGQNVDVQEVAQSLTETTYAMARISDDLQDTIMKVRMVPVSSVFSRFPRLVRDLSRKSGKQVDLIMEGEETELDKSVVEVIGDPLVHLIRNAMDHGVESEEERLKAGKQAKGTVHLRAYYRGNSVAIEIEDDGKGIDPEKMREVAVRKGIISAEEAKALDDREAMELIFAPGFSSAETITDISGRGVGMDVVRTNIKNLKGSVAINSELGKGTRFTLTLPLTLAIIDALMVNVAGEEFAIPLDAVSETTKIEAKRLTDVNGRKAVTLRGEVLGLVYMSDLLDLPRSEETEVLSVVVIHDNDRRLGIVVDKLHERQEIVIKPLGEYLGDLKGISGATIMGDGSVILILDPHEIYLMATSKAI